MSKEHAHSAWRSAESVKKLSDRVIGIGPFSVGLDGILTWIPGAGIIYSSGASLFLLYTALRGGASIGTVLKMAGYLGLDVLLSDFPIPGVADLFDLLWQGHLMAATALQKDIEGRHGVPEGLSSVLKRPRRRATGLGWLVLMTIVGLGYAVWKSDFNALTQHGWGYALANASLPVAGYAVGLPIILGGGALLMLVLGVLRARLQKRAA
jgi:hypothetical protein